MISFHNSFAKAVKYVVHQATFKKHHKTFLFKMLLINVIILTFYYFKI